MHQPVAGCAFFNYAGGAPSGIAAGLKVKPDADDLFDYSMSDQFVSETRPRPYRTGFRARSWRDAYSIEQAMTLNDREFQLWGIYRAGRAREPLRDSVKELSVLRAEVRRLSRQVDALSKDRNQSKDAGSRGLDVTAR